MNLKIKIDKYGNLVNLDTGTIILVSNELFTDNFWETDGTTWKVNTTTQVTASTSDAMPIVVPIGEFTQGSRVDFYFRLHLPILDYNKRVNIFEFGVSTASSHDISFYKLANSNGYCLYVDSTKQNLPIASTESLDIVGVLTMYNIGSNTLAVFITLYSNENGALTKLVENAYRGSSGNRLYFGVSRDYHTNLSSYMVEGIAFDEDIINPISAVTKYLNGTGLSEVWTNTKNYISAQLLGKSDVGHTHTASDITSGLATVATSGSYNDLSNKPTIPTVNNATLTIQKNGTNVQTFTANQSTNATANITVPTKTSDLTNDSGFLTSHQSLSNYVTLDSTQTITAAKTISANLNFSTTYTRGTTPSSTVEKELIDYRDSAGNRICLFESAVYSDKSSQNFIYAYNTSVASGGNIGYLGIGSKADGTVFTHSPTPPTSDNSNQIATTKWAIPRSGGAVLNGLEYSRPNSTGYLKVCGGYQETGGASLILFGKTYTNANFVLKTTNGTDETHSFVGGYNGTLSWDGTAIQYVSDQRLKQQISEIDDKLLDAWEDVNLVQFKYNDAVKEKSDNARLHTGYVVQQIDDACKSHGVDVSKYGLYCHEVYQEETREVEHEDGTKTVEVVRPANEHYSLRYTEALIVECAYLRKCIKELRNEIEQLKSSK